MIDFNANPFIFVRQINKYRWLLLVAFFCFGLYLSLKVVLGSFRFDPDTSHSLMLWYGISEYGLSWIQDWRYTHDNWLFSLVPIHFLEFWIFGPKPALVIGTGWLIFIASVVTASLIVRELQSKYSLYIVPGMLIFMGLYAHQPGFVSYSTSHNITNLFGLLSIWLLIRFVKANNWYWLILIFLLQISGGISDPWLVPAFTLPIAIIAAIQFFRVEETLEKKQYFWIFSVMIFSMFLIKTLFFGILGFLPRAHFSIGDWTTISSNAIYLLKDLGGLFNLVPGVRSNPLIASFISLAVIIMLYVKSMQQAYCDGPDTSKVVLYGVVFFSTGGIALAFILTSIPASNWSARFLINIPYLIAIAICLSFEESWSRTSALFKIFSILAGLLFVVSGMVSNVHLLKKPGFSINLVNLPEFVAFLDKNELKYGYGPYWGSASNAVTALTNNRIKIRPIVFDKRSGQAVFDRRVESSRHWYVENDVPDNQTNYFVVVKRDNENCPIPQDCVNGLTGQFGDPSKTLSYKNALILVWDHPLVGWVNTNYMSVELNKKVVFKFDSQAPVWYGWSSPEKWGTWSDGDTSILLLSVSEIPENDIKLYIEGRAFLTDKHTVQEIDVIVNKEYISTLQYKQPSDEDIRVVTIPRWLLQEHDGLLSIRFNYANPISPDKLNLSGDVRRLGLGLVSLELRVANQ